MKDSVEGAKAELKDSLKANKLQCENLLRRRFFYNNSFDIYGGTAGLFDYGPPGCALKTELENLWRQHFIVFDEMLEVSCPCITPHSVLSASGHVDRFTDLMIVDNVTGECFRADKYIEDILISTIEKLRNGDDSKSKPVTNEKLMQCGDEELKRLLSSIGHMSKDDITKFIETYGIKSPSGNQFSRPTPFNLMFETTIGTRGDDKSDSKNSVVYLRPETAQGIFVNFGRLLEYNGGRMPFASAQVGLGFRNEISPRNGLLRLREFLMAEIEYFVHPNDKTHAKYKEFKDVVISLLPRSAQEDGNFTTSEMSIESAIEQSTIGNEALGYFIARTSLFLEKCGVKREGIRFRQHMPDELAHYASDCWDAEILTSYGWIEVVGHADRMAYDLGSHSKATNTRLVANLRYPEPKKIEKVVPKYNKSLIGKTFANKSALILKQIEEMSMEDALKLEDELSSCQQAYIEDCCGNKFLMTREMVSFKEVEVTACEESFIPSVIEPSFGIGRLIFCILEHAYRVRPTEQNVQEERSYLSLDPKIAPIKCCILPLSSKDVFFPFIYNIQAKLSNLGISYKIDKTGASIGKRYARTDEIGVPFAITIDFQSVNDGTVTLRERDSMEQVRIDLNLVSNVISDLLRGSLSWEQIKNTYPTFTQQEI